MTRSLVVQLSLAACMASVIAAAFWSVRRTQDAEDYVIARRRLEPWLAAFGYVGGTTSAWMTLLVVAAAFVWGRAAVWLALGLVCGAALGTVYVAPRLRHLAAAQGTVTLTQLIAVEVGERSQQVFARAAAFVGLTLLAFQCAIVLRGAAELLAAEAGIASWCTIVFGAGLLGACVLAGGLRAASFCDVIQTAAVAVCVLLLPIPAFVAIGGWDAFASGLSVLGPEVHDWFTGKRGVVALAIAVGGIGVGCAIVGQPHTMARLIAARDDRAWARLRWIVPLATGVLVAAALLAGWSARVLYDGLEQPHLALHALATRLLPPAVAAVFVVALCASLLLSIASPLLALATQCAVDLHRTGTAHSAGWTRAALVLATAGIVALAFVLPLASRAHVLLPFLALGASFGPLLLVRVSGKRVRPGSALGAMWAGYLLTVIFHLLPDSPGDFLERVLPFVASLGIALTGGERRRNPDRADRVQETLHDRIPI
nr:hypothetical protein [Gammaproteobacteria bacterium]